ncbi:hypothetical protein MTO96_032514 [Rhipicephalus appendiculatus]
MHQVWDTVVPVIQPTLQQSAANSSNALDCENVCVEFTVADTTAGGKDGTQENREKARSISTTDSTAGDKGSTKKSREEASSKSATGSTTEGKGRTQGNREEGSSKDSVGSTAGGKGGTQDNRGEACSHCAAVSTVEGKCEARNNREEACSKCATTSTAGGKGVKQQSSGEACSISAADLTSGAKGGTPLDNVASREAPYVPSATEAGTVPDAAVAIVSTTEPGISIVAAGYDDLEVASVTEPDIHMETLTEHHVITVSLSDPDVTMRSVSEDAAVMPVSVSLTCIKCHSQLGLQICGASKAGAAEREGAVGVFPVAQARPGVCEQPQRFSVPSPHAVPQASPGMQIPSAKLQPQPTISSIPITQMPPTIQPFATAQQLPSTASLPPISDTSTMGNANF